MTTQPNSDRELAEKIVLEIGHYTDNFTQRKAENIIAEHLSHERAARDAEIAKYKNRLEYLWQSFEDHGESETLEAFCETIDSEIEYNKTNPLG